MVDPEAAPGGRGKPGMAGRKQRAVRETGSARGGLPRIVRLSEPRDRQEQLAEDARRGLGSTPKSLPPKYFYDERGSRLFEEITRLPEYYPTRTETAILESASPGIVSAVDPDELVEIGSGSSRKTRLLIEAMGLPREAGRYVAFDLSESALGDALRALHESYSWLELRGVLGDFETDIPRIPRQGRGLVAFLGSTLGNLDSPGRVAFLRELAGLLGPDDGLLLGLDLVKDPAVLEAAYNDARGVTAAFNLNVLEVLNRELEGDLPVEAFEHVALYDRVKARIEMRLRASREIEAELPLAGIRLRFAAGEEILTEISCKFTRAVAERELGDAGLGVERWDTDPRSLFALALARPLRASGD
jgi:L-histidine N-alpha-methyltransferase